MTKIVRPGVAVLILVAAGCGGASLYPVRGQLVYPDGSPATDAAGATVTFEGTGADGRAYGASGVVDENGRFEMSSERPGDGVVLGTNKVLIAPKVVASDAPPVRVLDEKYEQFDTSKLVVEVEAKANDFKLTVEKRKRK